MSSVLARAGQPSVATDPQSALELLSTGKIHVLALVTNTPEKFRAFGATLPLIYTTSCPDPDAARGFQVSYVLQKPFDGPRLLDAFHQVSDLVIG